jgi:hypothetical protein
VPRAQDRTGADGREGGNPRRHPWIGELRGIRDERGADPGEGGEKESHRDQLRRAGSPAAADVADGLDAHRRQEYEGRRGGDMGCEMRRRVVHQAAVRHRGNRDDREDERHLVEDELAACEGTAGKPGDHAGGGEQGGDGEHALDEPPSGGDVERMVRSPDRGAGHVQGQGGGPEPPGRAVPATRQPREQEEGDPEHARPDDDGEGEQGRVNCGDRQHLLA